MSSGSSSGTAPARDHGPAVRADAARDDGAQSQQGGQVKHCGSADDPDAASAADITAGPS